MVIGIRRRCGLGVGRNRDKTSDGSHCLCVVLLGVTGRRFGAHFVLLGANIGVDANIVVCELSHLSIVDTDNLGLLRGTEAEARDEVHNPEDDSCHDKGVAHTSA